MCPAEKIMSGSLSNYLDILIGFALVMLAGADRAR
jgi:hypothetical protein